MTNGTTSRVTVINSESPTISTILAFSNSHELFGMKSMEGRTSASETKYVESWIIVDYSGADNGVMDYSGADNGSHGL